MYIIRAKKYPPDIGGKWDRNMTINNIIIHRGNMFDKLITDIFDRYHIIVRLSHASYSSNPVVVRTSRGCYHNCDNRCPKTYASIFREVSDRAATHVVLKEHWGLGVF